MPWPSTIFIVNRQPVKNFIMSVTKEPMTCSSTLSHVVHLFFFKGLRNSAYHQDYMSTCYDTVYTLQNIARKHGKCRNEITKEVNAVCISKSFPRFTSEIFFRSLHQLVEAVVATIKACITRLHELTEPNARFYCGQTLMKHCAFHVGLEHHPVSSPFASPVDG